MSTLPEADGEQMSQVFPPEAAGQVYLPHLPSRKQLDVASSSGLSTTSTSCGPEQFINLLQASSLRWQPAPRLMGTLLWISQILSCITWQPPLGWMKLSVNRGIVRDFRTHTSWKHGERSSNGLESNRL
ncbi:hypothetical protein EYF80_043170 [Liparis tanakae]|uniref:Uncharacterized protein n=1 Tax=Liparis tanakae TaxID=230148 RepID=A0A4Z2FZI4_9TELE|nr:hypothetical protein EYF80_043170 [Liparis tanakae]